MLLHPLERKPPPMFRRSLPPLARVARYGDVRGTDASSVGPIITGLVERITIGLLPAADADYAAVRALSAISSR